MRNDQTLRMPLCNAKMPLMPLTPPGGTNRGKIATMMR
eukprot:CAMPEP_0172885856 /NCGR_PEP_ID=MMETSP1075-20121228/129312_1 /TAXON_ID=2916 /ORGANISM="Ceratium fusus, Strain PA161109" /LENGTH=37 /DNA_ID= /DNA_START= /DNA_END= /DNA_ORIENTATION=